MDNFLLDKIIGYKKFCDLCVDKFSLGKCNNCLKKYCGECKGQKKCVECGEYFCKECYSFCQHCHQIVCKKPSCKSGFYCNREVRWHGYIYTRKTGRQVKVDNKVIGRSIRVL